MDLFPLPYNWSVEDMMAPFLVPVVEVTLWVRSPPFWALAL